jgi:hypothetical protein
MVSCSGVRERARRPFSWAFLGSLASFAQPDFMSELKTLSSHLLYDLVLIHEVHTQRDVVTSKILFGTPLPHPEGIHEDRPLI